ncbi:hypothetical protein ABIE65_004695 [Constrictibacter sp. MBR-5]|jgi:hypothetical protein
MFQMHNKRLSLTGAAREGHPPTEGEARLPVCSPKGLPGAGPADCVTPDLPYPRCQPQDHEQQQDGDQVGREGRAG